MARSNDPIPFPPFSQRVVTFVHAAQRHLQDGMRKCTEAQIQSRLKVCHECASYAEGFCRDCGCHVNNRPDFLNKLSWQSEACPQAKWAALTDISSEPPPEARL
eukprot:TRINITY_DN398_c0_g1_i1.p1 TRINITY_DN398_c0_g1~~TRINITY_DN398_c0_g1_i1.p1  ORF type:complete len:104 (-),score=6.85 TRINITY_DN398_c0_g1_i1:139-450(-)